MSLRFQSRIVFDALSLDVPGGQFTAVLGESGIGKTSLLRLAAGLLAPDTGRVIADDNAPLAPRIAYMAQQDLLVPWLDALGNVTLGARLRGERPDVSRAKSLIERVGLAGREASLPATLSGGMRQRVALARTLYEDRPVILMDEPFSALDTVTRLRVQDLASDLLRDRTVLMITHDPMEAARLAHRVIVLQGRPARASTTIPVFGSPPRQPDDPQLLRLQGRLTRALTEGAAP